MKKNNNNRKKMRILVGLELECVHHFYEKAMLTLFDVQVPAISKHLKNIFEEGELSENATVSKMEIVVNRGFRGEVVENVEFYNLDAIISVGYRVNSAKASQF
jgi:hypothetical protein